MKKKKSHKRKKSVFAHPPEKGEYGQRYCILPRSFLVLSWLE
ncbi:hypothetical protein [Bacillus cereus]|nr:hypothetical protein GGBNIMDK_00054 [Bacillus cereus]